MPRFGRVVLGGTFDRLHVGHEAMLATAFREGRTVAIGVTTDGYLARHPKPAGARIARYRSRRAALVRWLSARYPASRWTVAPLENSFGRSVETGVDALVISADTRPGGEAVNAERRRLGRRAVPLRVVPLVLGDDLRPVSSRRIRAGEIDRWGRRRSPIRVGLAVDAPDDRSAAARGVRRAFPRARLAAVRLGNVRGPRAALRAAEGAELGVAVTGRRAGSRRVGVATPRLALEPVVVRGRFPADLADRVAHVLRRSSGPNSFKATHR